MLQVRSLRFRLDVVRLVWLAALAAMLACPIDYRGGAELPHAHAIFQLLYDAAHGSIDHHHDGDAPAAADDFGSELPSVQTTGLTQTVGARLSPMGESAEGLVAVLAVVALWRA
ncbi:MAG TPA: hypothetical protein VFU81_22545, partial [Thermomicrobiales bacterium]|nr:hypothetical protein [Thermomicrobiales bacterium]